MVDSAPPGQDLFGPGDGVMPRLAARIRCTEGQLYSMLAGTLLMWAVSANALPGVVWDASPAANRSSLAAPAPSGSSPTPPGQPGLLAAPPTPARPVLGSPLESPSYDGGLGSTPFSTTPFGSPAAEAAPSDGGQVDGDEGIAAGEGAEGGDVVGPVRVVAGGYASASAGTPLATAGVPEGSVAVARRGNRPDKIAFLRLRGSSTPLELEVDPAGATTLDGLASVQLCIVTEHGWEVGRGDVSLADAPTYDCDGAIPGERSASGDRWTFDLSTLDLTDVPGVALLPAEGAVAPEFQVVFRLAADDGDASGKDER